MASGHELLVFSSHFARVFYLSPPKSTKITLFSNFFAKKLKNKKKDFKQLLDFTFFKKKLSRRQLNNQSQPNGLHFTDITFQAASVGGLRIVGR